MYNTKKPPLFAICPTEFSKGRSPTPNFTNEEELKRLKKAVNEARNALSGHSSPVSTKETLDLPEESSTYHLFNENIILKNRIKEMQYIIRSLNDNQKSVGIEESFQKSFTNDEIQRHKKKADKHIAQAIQGVEGSIGEEVKKHVKVGYGNVIFQLIEFYENQFQNLIKKLEEYSNFIQKLFIHLDLQLEKPAHDLKSYMDIIDLKFAQIKEANLLLLAVSKHDGPVKINQAGRDLLFRGYGKGFIEFLQKLQNDIFNSKHEISLKDLLAAVLPPEDLPRTMRFLKEGDIESAVCIIKNLRASQAFLAKGSPASSQAFRSLTPNSGKFH